MQFKINNTWDTGRILKCRMNPFCLLWEYFLPQEVLCAAFQKCVFSSTGKIARVLPTIIKELPESRRMQRPPSLALALRNNGLKHGPFWVGAWSGWGKVVHERGHCGEQILTLPLRSLWSPVWTTSSVACFVNSGFIYLVMRWTLFKNLCVTQLTSNQRSTFLTSYC